MGVLLIPVYRDPNSLEAGLDLRDYADTLLQRNNEGDQSKAMSLLDESLAISSEVSMRPLMGCFH